MYAIDIWMEVIASESCDRIECNVQVIEHFKRLNLLEHVELLLCLHVC